MATIVFVSLWRRLISDIHIRRGKYRTCAICEVLVPTARGIEGASTIEAIGPGVSSEAKAAVARRRGAAMTFL